MIGNDPERRDMLLKETPEIETKRKALDAKVAGLESAIATLNTLAMRQWSSLNTQIWGFITMKRQLCLLEFHSTLLCSLQIPYISASIGPDCATIRNAGNNCCRSNFVKVKVKSHRNVKSFPLWNQASS